MSITSSSPSHSGSAGPHLQRRLGKLNMVALTFAILNTWIALAGVLGLILPSGGAVALLYGFIFSVFCNLCLVSSLGELASIWPTAGGQYHYSYMLSTEQWKRPASFCVAWLSTAGWLMLVTTEAYFAALLITAAAIMASDGTYMSSPWQVYLIFVAIIIFTTIFNLYGNGILGRWNNFAFYWSLLGLVTLCVTLLATSQKTDAKYVFTSFENITGWDNGVSWILGMLQSALSLVGSDAATHMSEEMPHPAKDTPRAMVYSIIVGGVTGFIFILVLLFCLQDIKVVLASATGMPITELIYRSTGSRAAATILTLALAICFINGTNGAVTAVSRLIYSLARDGGVPCSNYFAKIGSKFNVPSRAIMACFVFNLLFGLLYLGPSVAFNAYIASTTILLNISYAAPIVILLIRGRKVLDKEVVQYKLGRMGLVCNSVGVAFVVFTSLFFCFPTALPVTSSTMNFVSAVLGIFVLFLVITWAVNKENYQGPSMAILEAIGTDLQAETSGSGEEALEKGVELS